MERLTKTDWRDLSPAVVCALVAPSCDCDYPRNPCEGCGVPRIYAKLAAYEDTGLAPEQIDPNVMRPLKAWVRRKRKWN